RLPDEGEAQISPESRFAAAVAFGQAIAQARAVLVNEPFEPTEVSAAVGRRRIDNAVVTQVAWVVIPGSMIPDLRAEATWGEVPRPTRQAIGVHQRAFAVWFGQAASWVRTGAGAAEIFSSLPEAPILSGDGGELSIAETWFGILRHDIREILDSVG